MDAGIPVLYCVCLSSKPLSTQSPLARQAGLALLSALNAAIAPVNDVCHNLTLSNVIRVALLEISGNYVDTVCKIPKQNPDRPDPPAMYSVTISAKPSGGIFEGIISRCSSSSKFELQGDVNRLNLYGNTSHCVESPFLKKICYCKDQHVGS